MLSTWPFGERFAAILAIERMVVNALLDICTFPRAKVGLAVRLCLEALAALFADMRLAILSRVHGATEATVFSIRMPFIHKRIAAIETSMALRMWRLGTMPNRAIVRTKLSVQMFRVRELSIALQADCNLPHENTPFGLAVVLGETPVQTLRG